MDRAFRLALARRHRWCEKPSADDNVTESSGSENRYSQAKDVHCELIGNVSGPRAMKSFGRLPLDPSKVLLLEVEPDADLEITDHVEPVSEPQARSTAD